MNFSIDYLYQQILDTEQQVQNRMARVAEGNISFETNLWNVRNSSHTRYGSNLPIH